MASAGIQFVASANASAAANGAAAMPAAGDVAPVDFAALLFAAQASPLNPALAELGILDPASAESGLDSEDEADASDLALLLGGLIAPPAGQTARQLAASGSAEEPLAAEDAATALSAGKPHVLAADAEAADGALLAKATALSGKGESAANLAEASELLPAGSTGSGLQLGHLFAAPGQTPGALPPAASSLPTAHVAAPLHDAQWGHDFAQRVVWMARSEMQSAHLSLNPANLGPIEVTLSLGAEHATAVFSSPHGEVREALEAALPRLREMLAGAGISLGDAHVNAQSQREMAQSQQHGQRATASGNGSGAILGADDAVDEGNGQPIRIGRGLIDTFA